jgi:hypothetical protein
MEIIWEGMSKGEFGLRVQFASICFLCSWAMELPSKAPLSTNMSMSVCLRDPCINPIKMGRDRRPIYLRQCSSTIRRGGLYLVCMTSGHLIERLDLSGKWFGVVSRTCFQKTRGGKPFFKYLFFIRDICIWVVCGFAWFQERIPKRHVFKNDWIACSKFDDHYELESQHNWGDLYDHITFTIIFTLTIDKIFTQALKSHDKLATTWIWIRRSSSSNHMFPILEEVG